MPCQLENLLLNAELDISRIGVCNLQIKIGSLLKDGSILERSVEKDSLDFRQSQETEVIHP